MAVNAQVFGVEVRSVEHDVVGSQELSLGHDFEAQPQDMATVDGIGIRVVDLEGGDGAAYAIETLLIISLLLVGFAEELCARWHSIPRREETARWLEKIPSRRRSEDGGSFDLERLAQRSDCYS